MEIKNITKDDLDLITDLSTRKFEGNSMSSNTTKEEKKQFDTIKENLKTIAVTFKERLDNSYGKLEVSVTTGNPLIRGANKLGRVWSGIFKGTEEKQYSAQISFVIDASKSCLNVGFYFGRASSHSFPVEKKKRLESQLKEIGRLLSGEIQTDPTLNNKFNSLFDYGFRSYSNGKLVSSDKWLRKIADDPKDSQITCSIFPNDEGFIEFKTLDLYVSMVAGLMGAVPSLENNFKGKYKPLTPEQRAKQAERRVLIGTEGELFALQKEKERLKAMGVSSRRYPKHVALESDSYGYDILSCNSDGSEIFIEVKTTTRTMEDPASRKFYISSNEYEFFKSNPDDFFLYRVYDIEGENPSLQKVDMNSIELNARNYLVEYSASED